jgi:hypothetical protein
MTRFRKLQRKTQLPAPADENMMKIMVAAVQRNADAVRDKMTKEAALPWLQSTLEEFLRQGAVDTLKVVEAAYAGDDIADAALRRVYAEMREARIFVPTQLAAYGIKAVQRPPLTRRQGRSSFDNWRRDIGIAVLVFFAIKQFNLGPTRNREQRRRRQPSASSLVAEALGRGRPPNQHQREVRREHLSWPRWATDRFCHSPISRYFLKG